MQTIQPKQRTFLLSLIIALVVAIAACSGSGNPDGNKNSTWDNMRWDSGVWQ